MSTWFTADQHFGHAKIIGYCKRPYADVREMDEGLTEAWNAVVRPGDEVYVLGDFALGTGETVGHYLRRLRGRKHLVWGNHDRGTARSIKCWASSQGYLDTTLGDQRVVLMHYALRTWPGAARGALHLYGHSHGMLAPHRRSLDVGVDCWSYRPVSLEEIRARLAATEAAAA